MDGGWLGEICSILFYSIYYVSYYTQTSHIWAQDMEPNEVIGGFHLLQQADQSQDGDESGPGEIAEGFGLVPERPRRGHRGEKRLPRGVALRSHGHADIMRRAKKAKQARATIENLSSALCPIADAWNRSFGLRVGDRLAVPSDPGGAVAPEAQCNHNTWSLSGVMAQAWGQVGQHAGRQQGDQGIGDTRRVLDALFSLAGALQMSIRQRLSSWLDNLPGHALHIERHHDPTQLRLKFGGLQDVLAPCARYVVPDLARPPPSPRSPPPPPPSPPPPSPSTPPTCGGEAREVYHRCVVGVPKTVPTCNTFVRACRVLRRPDQLPLRVHRHWHRGDQAGLAGPEDLVARNGFGDLLGRGRGDA